MSESTKETLGKGNNQKNQKKKEEMLKSSVPKEAKTLRELHEKDDCGLGITEKHDPALDESWVPLELYQRLLAEASLINKVHDEARERIQKLEAELKQIQQEMKAWRSNAVSWQRKAREEFELGKGLEKRISEAQHLLNLFPQVTTDFPSVVFKKTQKEQEEWLERLRASLVRTAAVLQINDRLLEAQVKAKDEDEEYEL